jgi:hypothetical protein
MMRLAPARAGVHELQRREIGLTGRRIGEVVHREAKSDGRVSLVKLRVTTRSQIETHRTVTELRRFVDGHRQMIRGGFVAIALRRKRLDFVDETRLIENRRHRVDRKHRRLEMIDQIESWRRRFEDRHQMIRAVAV